MLKFGLIGCGRIAQRHAEFLGSCQVRGACLKAVCDIDAAKARALGARFNVPCYADMEQMLEKEALDAVSVLTPSQWHAQHAIAAAKYKKHIVVEKPMALNLEDADAMISACEAAGVKLFVVKQNRCNYPVQKLKEAVEDKRFGKIVLGTVRLRWCREQAYYDQDPWRSQGSGGGGVIFNQACHFIDLLLWLLGEPESVFARSSTALVDINAEDTGVAVIKFQSGALGVVEATTAARPKDLEGSISVLGEKGAVEIGGFAANEMKTWNFTETRQDDRLVLDQYRENPPNIYGFGHRTYLQGVVDAINGQGPVAVDGWEGRKSVALINAIYRSIASGRDIHLSRPASGSLKACHDQVPTL